MAERRFGALEVLGAIPETPLVVNNVVLQAVGKRRQDWGLQNGSFDLKDMLQNGKGRICYGGQDAVGAVLFPVDDRNKIQAVMAAADGCSFGDEVNSAEAAKMAVSYNLSRWGHLLSKQDNLRPVPDMAKSIFLETNKFISERLPNGVTTATVAIVSYELISDRPQILLTLAWAGDSQAMILGLDASGTPFLHRLVVPHDMLYFGMAEKLDVMDGNFTNLSQQQIIKARDDELLMCYLLSQEFEFKFNPNVIASHLGISKGKTNLELSFRRVNISENYFAQGCTKLKLIVCSDNLGEKVEKNRILGEYQKTIADPKANIVLAQSLGEYMAQQNLDDGCMVIADLGRIRMSN